MTCFATRSSEPSAITGTWFNTYAERRPIADAFRRDTQFVAFSHDAMQLRPYLERFGRDRIAVGNSDERLIADPAGVMRGLYEWLEVDPAAADPFGSAEPENVGPETVSMAAWAGVPRRLGQTPWLRRVAIERLPPAVRCTLHSLTTREVRRRAVDATEAVAFLLPPQLRQTEELARLLSWEPSGMDDAVWQVVKWSQISGPVASFEEVCSEWDGTERKMTKDDT